MQVCKKHWAAMKQSLADRGLDHLGAKSGEDAFNDAVSQLNGEETDWDPLMSMNWNFVTRALQLGGLYLMTEPPEGKGHTDCGKRDWCPVCEAELHGDPTWIQSCADAFLVYAREKGLVPNVQ